MGEGIPDAGLPPIFCNSPFHLEGRGARAEDEPIGEVMVGERFGVSQQSGKAEEEENEERRPHDHLVELQCQLLLRAPFKRADRGRGKGRKKTLHPI